MFEALQIIPSPLILNWNQPRFQALNQQFDQLITIFTQILAKLGHRLKQVTGNFGNMQVITWDRQKNTLSAASDPRGEGSAIIK